MRPFYNHALLVNDLRQHGLWVNINLHHPEPLQRFVIHSTPDHVLSIVPSKRALAYVVKILPTYSNFVSIDDNRAFRVALTGDLAKRLDVRWQVYDAAGLKNSLSPLMSVCEYVSAIHLV